MKKPTRQIQLHKKPQKLEVPVQKVDSKIPLSKNDKFFKNPQVIAQVKEGMEDIKAGRIIKVEMQNLDKFLGL
ncbi:hypothetical protein [Algoriphagus sp.]|uniref:hypothetical protein n=1 Tax=Algoriphagus sp. TaxID=1872435 RepID=UPI00391A5129